MPILHTQFAGEVQQPDGSKVQLRPPQALQMRGPVVQVTVSVAQAVAEALLKLGRQLPPPLPGWALIDTGASETCIDEEAAQQLKLPVIDVVNMISASHSSTLQNVYPIQIEMVGLPITINVPRTIGANLKPQGLLLLIGREVLQHGTLMYNGMAGEITFAI